MSRRAILPWVWYSIVLTLTFVPLVWLTQKVIHLDDAQREAMRKFDQEERVGRARWRMDVKLMPLLAQEAMWSEESFQPLVQAGITGGGKGVTTQQLSPLLANPLPDHVLMYFELEGDQPLRSPLVPQGKSRDVVLRASVSLETIKKAEGRLAELEKQIDGKVLIAQLPAIPTETELATLLNLPGQDLGYQNSNSAIVGNNYILPEGGENLTRGITQGNGNNVDSPGSQNGGGPFLNVPSQREGINLDNQNGLATNNGRMAKPRKGAFEDLENRNAVYQAITQKKGTDRRGMEEVVAKEAIRSSAWQPVWMDKVLILARQVKQGERHWVQGVWLNWQYLQEELRAEVDDLQLPPFAFQAAQLSIESSHPHLLATLPVEMVLDEKSGQGGLWNSALRWSLVVAWLGILAASIAAGVVLQGVTALSERRAAFVSAVTHELRTPLTTFRMYAEMLAENMVSSDEQRQAYAGTLKTEADRLAHLVENVLEYAQLERGKNKARREPIRMESLMERIEPRLRERGPSRTRVGYCVGE